MNVWFTSDTHFNHQSMVTKGWRPFASVEEMNETLIEKWNRVVHRDDQVWHLGDVGMGTLTADAAIVSQLNGQKHLIGGNHDSVWSGHREAHKRQTEWMAAYGFLSVQSFARRRIDGRQVMISHFPYVGDHTEGSRYDEYRLPDKGMWLLHGHVHDTWLQRGRQINVGVDVWGWAPVSLNTLADLMRRHDAEG